jgi:sigma-B regulation protein RsbU (phosphoserine phosphatase)
MLRNIGNLQSTRSRRNSSKVRSAIMSSMTSPSSSELLRHEIDSLAREKLDLHSQLFEAARIQRKLSGPRMFRNVNLQFASEVFAARYLSGDFTTFSQNGSRVFVVLGDIAGKGIAAGMWFTNMAGLLQSYGGPDAHPSMIATQVNHHLCDLRPVAPFVTAFLARIDCDLGQIDYCNAGHFPPILLHSDGRVDLLEIGGPLLGAIEPAEFQTGRETLQPGDALVAYSDGFLECHNASGEEFGTDRLIAALKGIEKQSAQTTLMLLLAAVQDFANGLPLCDDVSLTVIQHAHRGEGAAT